MKTGQSSNSTGSAPPLFGARIALLFSAFFFYLGIYLPYFPLWLKEKGLDSTQISIVLSVALIVRVVSSGQITAYADKANDRANVLIFLFVATAFSVLLYELVDGFWPIVLVALLLGIFHNPIQPVLDSLTLSGVRRFGADYGKIRLWGSVVFVLANIAGGWLLAGGDADLILHVLVVSAFIGAILSPLLPRIGKPRHAAHPLDIANNSSRKLLANRVFMFVVIAQALLQASHATLYSFGSIHWQNAGFSGVEIGVFWAVGVIAEIVLFQFSKQVFRFVTPLQLMLIGAVAVIVRWSIMPFDLSMTETLALQSLHGLTFGASHIGFMFYLNEAVPEERSGVAQAVGFTIGGVAMAGFMLISGPLYGAYSANAFLAMAFAGMVACALLMAVIRNQPQSSSRAGDTMDDE